MVTPLSRSSACTVLSRKKARRILVDGVEYFWAATGSDGTIDLIVERQISGSSKLTCMFPYGGEHGAKQVSLTPHVVRQTIEYALQEKGWTPDQPGDDLRLGLHDHEIDIRGGRIDRFYRLFEKLQPELHPDYENHRKYGEAYLDMEFIEDALWVRDPGDEFWQAMIDVFRFDFLVDTTRLESRLSGARTVEVADGYAGAFLAKSGAVYAWAHALDGRAPSVKLNAHESRTLAAGLRELATLIDPDVVIEGPSSIMTASSGAGCIELSVVSGLVRLDSDAAEQLADALEAIGPDASVMPPTSLGP